MKGIKVAYIEGVHPASFGYCRRVEVIGVRLIDVGMDERVIYSRPCLHVRYHNGEEDFVPLESVDSGEYVFVHKDGAMLAR